MKTEFELEQYEEDQWVNRGKIKIIGKQPMNRPYVVITGSTPSSDDFFIADKDLERFAVNILKALNSKRLNP